MTDIVDTIADCLIQDHIDLITNNKVLATQLEIAMGALNRLACLGNGDQYGNSMGNDIAICAIKQVQELAK